MLMQLLLTLIMALLPKSVALSRRAVGAHVNVCKYTE